MKKVVILFIFIWMFLPVSGQIKHKLLFEGVVYGYQSDITKKLLKKTSKSLLEGVISEVDVVIYKTDSVVVRTETNNEGEFSLALDLQASYKLVLTKLGYDTCILFIDALNIPDSRSAKGLRFSGTEFLLASNKNERVPNSGKFLGKLFFDTVGGYFDFIPNEDRLIKRTIFGDQKAETDNSLVLLDRAIIKNKNNTDTGIEIVSSGKKTNKSNKSNPGDKKSEILPKDTVKSKIVSPFNLKLGLTGKKNLLSREEEIKNAREQLERDKLIAVTYEDSLLIREREAKIIAAEFELENIKLELIHSEELVKSQKKFIIIICSALFLLMIMVVIVYIFYKNKKKLSMLLGIQNKRILDSIAYAERIQQSVLLKEKEIKKYLPEMFIYFQPKDIVSGDFYWFLNIENKLILAVIDCTGHGVPGAFMSLIGNSLLNKIVTEYRIFEPTQILNCLHKEVINSLHQEQSAGQSNDGMDMAICIIEPSEHRIAFAGAMNSLYIVKDSTTQTIQGSHFSIGGKMLYPGREIIPEFKTNIIDMQPGMSYYLTTDGYIDQFNYEDKVKFGMNNFKKTLVDIQRYPMEKQKYWIAKNISEWKKETKQLDDMLVVGFKV